MQKRSPKITPGVERLFLLAKRPSGFADKRQTPIVQGYLATELNRQIRVRRQGWRCFLTIQDGRGTSRDETETALSREQFDTLWPLTAGCRVEKRRLTGQWIGHGYTIDLFGGEHSGLEIAEIRFASAEEAEAFVPPKFLGREITGRREFENAHLAAHGLPPPSLNQTQIGAMPFLFRRGKLFIVLVTTSSGNRWIVPKGHLEPHMTRHQVALEEAAEEAGAVGAIEPGFRSSCHFDNGRELQIYPLRVSTLLKRWPEATVRKRMVVPLAKALKTVQDKGLVRCMERLSRRLKEHP